VEEYLGLIFDKGRFRVNVPATDESQRLFDEILDNASNAFSDPGFLVLSASIQYYITVLASAKRADRHHSRKSEERVIECIDYLTGHLNAPHTLASLSARANMSVPHLSYLFKQRTGISPMRYLTRMRIRRACELLDSTDMQIKDIAYEVGYEDPFYFTRLFTSAVGASPRAYRESVKG
jgi:AraC-like DNA-binding protein